MFETDSKTMVDALKAHSAPLSTCLVSKPFHREK